jgi:hypothetical protein
LGCVSVRMRPGGISGCVVGRSSSQAFDFIEGAVEGLGLDGLEQVVDGIYAEGLERVLVVCGSEDDDGLGGQAGEDFEAVEARHLDIEEAEVGGMVGESGDGFFGFGGCTEDFNAAGCGEESAESIEGEGFVVDEIRAEGHERGTVIWTMEALSWRKTLRLAFSP